VNWHDLGYFVAWGLGNLIFVFRVLWILCLICLLVNVRPEFVLFVGGFIRGSLNI